MDFQFSLNVMKTTKQILNPTNTEKVSQPFSSQFLLKRVFLTPAGTARLGWQQGRSVTDLNQSNTSRGIQNHTATKIHLLPSASPSTTWQSWDLSSWKEWNPIQLVNSLTAKSKATSDHIHPANQLEKLVKKIAIRVVWDFYHHLVLAHLPCIRNGWVAYP